MPPIKTRSRSRLRLALPLCDRNSRRLLRDSTYPADVWRAVPDRHRPWHLHTKVAREAEIASQQQQMAPPSNGTNTAVTLYVASDEAGALRRTQATISLPSERSERARAVLRALLGTYLQSGSPHPIAPG